MTTRAPARSLPRSFGAPRFGRANLAIVALALGALVWSAAGTQFAPTALVEANNLKSVSRFASGLWPPEVSPDFLKTVLGLTLQTVQISVMGTAIAIVLGFPLGALALRRRGEEMGRAAMGTLPWLLRWTAYYASRSLLNILRAVPELVWALVFVVAVGLGPFPGVLALAAHSTGILGKLYAELFESVDQRLVEAGRSTGASDLGVLLFMQLPATLPVVLSYTFFRWECNMRAATVLGFVGAGGIGSQLAISMKLFAYHEVATLALAILALVILVDLVGQLMRARLLDPRAIACEPLLLDE